MNLFTYTLDWISHLAKEGINYSDIEISIPQRQFAELLANPISHRFGILKDGILIIYGPYRCTVRIKPKQL